MKKLLKFSILLSLFVPLFIPWQLDSATVPVNHLNKKFIRQGLSTNWSGYAALTSLTNPLANSVSSVKGDWVVPNLTCTSQTTYSSAWVGIDGYSDGTVEQIGTEHDCSVGNARYYVWYEMYPHSMKTLRLAVAPGDNIHGEVNYTGSNYFNLKLSNLTTGKNVSVTSRQRALRTSAEWVVEAPSSFFGVLPLANFGTINIANAAATINGHTGSINDSSWQFDKIIMVTNDLTQKAIPNDLDAGGQSFSVTWNHQ